MGTYRPDRKWAGVNEFSRFYDLVAAGNEGNDQAFFESLQSQGWNDSKVIKQFEQWSESDPQATARGLANKAPSTAVRRLAIQGLVNHLQESDPDSAMTWQRELDD